MFSPVCLPEQSDNFEGQIGWVYGMKFDELFSYLKYQDGERHMRIFIPLTL